MLPDSVESKVSRVIEKTLQLALDVALRTLDDEGKSRRPKLLTHKLLADSPVQRVVLLAEQRLLLNCPYQPS